MLVWLTSGPGLCLLASAVIPLEGNKAALRFRVFGLFSFGQWYKNSPSLVTRTPESAFAGVHWNTFLAVSSDTTFKSWAKPGLSTVHSNNNSSGERAGCCCRQGGEVQPSTAWGLQHTGQARAVHRGCASALSQLHLQSDLTLTLLGGHPSHSVPVHCPRGAASPLGTKKALDMPKCNFASCEGRTLAWTWKFSLPASDCTSWKQFNLHPNNLF